MRPFGVKNEGTSHSGIYIVSRSEEGSVFL